MNIAILSVIFYLVTFLSPVYYTAPSLVLVYYDLLGYISHKYESSLLSKAWFGTTTTPTLAGVEIAWHLLRQDFVGLISRIPYDPLWLPTHADRIKLGLLWPPQLSRRWVSPHRDWLIALPFLIFMSKELRHPLPTANLQRFDHLLPTASLQRIKYASY